MATAGLRQRRRDELLHELRTIAHRHLVEQGAAALSLRAIARDAGIAVSALYRYFPDRDGLLTDLLVRAFDSQADAVEAAAATAADPASAIEAGCRAYRQWSLANPAEFGLAYGAPVPGYAAPGEQTIRAGARIGDHLVGLIVDAYHNGHIDHAAIDRRAVRLTPDTATHLERLRRRRDYDGPVELIALGMDAFLAVHGFVLMEVFGQLRPITPDATSYFGEVLTDQLRSLGLRA